MSYQQRDPLGMYKSNEIRGPGPAVRHGPGPELMGANTLIGNEVYNSRSEDLGTIKEIMLDMRTGKVDYAVLSFGGILGFGQKLFAVPWDALTLDTLHQRFVLDVERERLSAAPGFDVDHWPNMADPAWAQDIRAYYGPTVTREQPRL